MENIIIIPKSSRQLAVIKDFLAKIDGSLKEIDAGKATRVQGKKQLHSFLDTL